MPMTLRDRLMTTLRGGTSDRIPWNIYGWILPDTEAGRRMHARGLGCMGSRRIFRPVYDGVTIDEKRFDVDGETRYSVRIDTPAGTLTEESVIDPSYGSRWIKKYFITGAQDYPAAEYLFRHTSFEPDYGPWHEAEAEMRDGGIVIGEIMPVPIVYIMVSWMGAEGLAEGLYEHLDAFDALMEALDRQYDRHIELAAASPAEVIWFPDNVTGTIISPRLFERYCAPVYGRAMPVLRAAAKIPIAHYDGSIKPLLQHVARTDLPVIEAVTPLPMGDITVEEAKAAWPDKVVWVNFPGSYFLEPYEVIKDYALRLLEKGAPGGRLVIGCTEDYPYSEFEKTFGAIGAALAEYEGYEWEE
ncbi:MAG: uroporphyrinogen decarboxylase family protein [Anaerolineae bacterium]